MKTAASLMLSLLLAPALARGQGFGVHEQGACAMARAGAGVAEPCTDGSAIYFNPAGLTGPPGIIVGGGGTAVFGTGSFTGDSGRRTALDTDVVLVPHLYFRYGLQHRVALGMGVYAPYGLRVTWPLDFAGRFAGYDSKLSTVYLQPSAAYAINDRVSIGGGLVIAVSSVDLRRREDLARVPLPVAGAPGLTFGALVDAETDFEDTNLSASGATGIGANLGVTVKLHERVRVGARYLSKISLSYHGDADFTPLAASYRVTKPNPLGLPVGTPLDPFVTQVQAALQDQAVRTEIDMPAQLLLGISVHATPRLTVFGDYQWTGWSSFRSVRLEFANPIPPADELIQNYRDTSGVRFGAEFSLTPALRLRGGYVFNQAAAPDETVTPILPEAERNHLTAGIGWALSSKLTIDAAYQFVATADRRGRIVNALPGTQPTVALNSGVYRSRADLFGVTLSFRP